MNFDRQLRRLAFFFFSTSLHACQTLSQRAHLQDNIDSVPHALLEVKALLHGGLLCGIKAADEEEGNGRQSDESQDHHPQVSLERVQKLYEHTATRPRVKSSLSRLCKGYDSNIESSTEHAYIPGLLSMNNVHVSINLTRKPPVRPSTPMTSI